MEYKTRELKGAPLDAAVAKAVGWKFELRHFHGDGSHPINKCLVLIDLVSGGSRVETFQPSTDWAQGGPIIEREGISVRKDRQTATPRFAWYALMGHDNEWPHCAETPLVAAMRAFVAAKIGDEVDL
jgi:hypothetical protein